MNFIYLLIEFIDELVFGVGEVALPFIRDDLQLSYTQIGLLLSIPGLIAAFIEPFIGILSSAWPSESQGFSCAQRTGSNSGCAVELAAVFVFFCMR